MRQSLGLSVSRPRGAPEPAHDNPTGRRPAQQKTQGPAPQTEGPGRSQPTLEKLPEYLEAHQVEALIRAAPNPRARLLFLIEWRAGLRISEALALEARDLSLEGDLPSLHVREGKGSKPRIVPVHPELRMALTSALEFGDVGQGDRLIRASRATADRWIKKAAARAVELGVIPAGRRVSNHTLRHSYARHLLAHGRPINFVSRWLGHASIHPTLIYLELVPDPTGSLASVP